MLGNREIKFRAWDKKRKRMYEVLHLHTATVFNRGIWATVKGRNIIEDKDTSIQIQPKDIEVMQYTGLKEKNGKEIYEGDLFKIEGNWPVYAVVYDEKTAAFGLKSPYGPFYAFSKLHDRNEVFTMIGNVHEHPHLLKEAESNVQA